MVPWRRLAVSVLLAVVATGCPPNRVCESSADCPQPDQQLCAQLQDSDVPAEVCEEGADTDCIPIARGCRCIVGAWAGNQDVKAGEAGILCID